MIPQNRHYKFYSLSLSSGATYTDNVLNIGEDLKNLAGSNDLYPATSTLIFFNIKCKFKINSILEDAIELDSNLMGTSRFELAYGDLLVDKIYFGENLAGTTGAVSVIAFG